MFSRKKGLSLKLTRAFIAGFCGFTAVVVAGVAPQITHADFNIKVIYGEDNRKDIYESDSALFRNLAASTVALVSASDVRIVGDVARLQGRTLRESMNVCASEPFSNQHSSAFCSGSLVGPDLILTAAHCIRSMTECLRTRFVFDFGINFEGRNPQEVAAKDVYSCKEIVGSQLVGTGADWAVIRIDRKVVDRPVLDIDTGDLANGTPLVVIGHPSGLPTKIADGAEVRDFNRNGYFVANLDTYGGNSGSAVFHADTGKIVGVLVRGETDYVFRNGCRVSNVCTNSGCRGEDVTKISEAAETIRSNQ